MKNVKLLKIGYACLLVVLVVGTYFWYNYFKETEGDVLAKNVRLELLNNGNINYINAAVEDSDDIIPVYYFRVRNNVDVPIKYNIYFQKIDSSSAADGCTSANLFTDEELDYELYKDNRVIKSGKVSTIANGTLLSDSMEKSMTNDYALKIKLNSNVQNSLGKHYHYVVTIEEIK